MFFFLHVKIPPGFFFAAIPLQQQNGTHKLIRAVVQSSSQTAQKFAKEFSNLYATQKKPPTKKASPEVKTNPLLLVAPKIPSKTKLPWLSLYDNCHFPSVLSIIPFRKAKNRGAPDQPEPVGNRVHPVRGFNLPFTHLGRFVPNTGGERRGGMFLPFPSWKSFRHCKSEVAGTGKRFDLVSYINFGGFVLKWWFFENETSQDEFLK